MELFNPLQYYYPWSKFTRMFFHAVIKIYLFLTAKTRTSPIPSEDFFSVQSQIEHSLSRQNRPNCKPHIKMVDPIFIHFLPNEDRLKL